MDQYLIELFQGTAPPSRVSLLVSLPGLEERRDQVGGLLRWPVSLTVVSLLDCGHVSFTRPRSILPVFLGTAQHFILNAYGLTLTTPIARQPHHEKEEIVVSRSRWLRYAKQNDQRP